MSEVELDRTAMLRAFNRAAAGYARHAVPQREVCTRLLARLDYIKCRPHTILDVGTGTGEAAHALLRRFPRARVVALDIAERMLHGVPGHRRLRRLQGDAEALPLRAGSVDLLFSASTFYWCLRPLQLYREIARVLSPAGLLLFATFGPDTLRELRSAWAAVDAGRHVHDFPDMHVLGDAMLQAGLRDPVVDAEWLQVQYPEPRTLMRDLKATGASNASPARRTGLRGRDTLRRLSAAYPRDPAGRCVATYEVVYGHAWAGAAHPGAVRVALHPAR